MTSGFKDSYLKFLKGFTIYTLFIALASIVFWKWIPSLPITAHFPWLLGFMYLFTSLVFYRLLKSLDNKLSRFVNVFMLLNFFKMIFYVIVIVAFAWVNRDEAVGFTITFFVYYLLFTTFEIMALLKKKA